jgi:predicted molibdopterin-dependent oxidoreductase YjgC
LRKYAQLYEADPGRYRGTARATARSYEHPEITYDPRKCILCGICIQIAQHAGEPLGLTMIGRGFDVRVDVPFDESLDAALKTAARRCAGACPTNALTRRESPSE